MEASDFTMNGKGVCSSFYESVLIELEVSSEPDCYKYRCKVAGILKGVLLTL